MALQLYSRRHTRLHNTVRCQHRRCTYKLDFVPPSTNTLILSNETNDFTRNTGRVSFHKYRDLLNFIASQRPEIHLLHVSLVLPRCTNRRSSSRYTVIVQDCNRDACNLNRHLRDIYCHSRLVFFFWTMVSSTSHLCMSSQLTACVPAMRALH